MFASLLSVSTPLLFRSATLLLVSRVAAYFCVLLFVFAPCCFCLRVAVCVNAAAACFCTAAVCVCAVAFWVYTAAVCVCAAVACICADFGKIFVALN